MDKLILQTNTTYVLSVTHDLYFRNDKKLFNLCFVRVRHKFTLLEFLLIY